jgi:formylglycine-generating enzyme required for sulfatase activity
MKESENQMEQSKAGGIEAGTLLWGRYEAVGALGESVLGKVWLCRDGQADGAPVVLRWLPPDVRRSKALLAVLHENIRRLADSSHPNVAPVRQMVYAGSEIYLVGDYAPGVTLAEWVEGGGGEEEEERPRPDLAQLLPLLEQAAAGLDFVHAQGAVHGNLTPTNVFVDGEGAVRVTDFGLSFRRHTAVRRGGEGGAGAEAEAVAAAFRAPERKTGEEADSAGDQYSLAALACWALTGRCAPEAGDLASWPPAVRKAFRRAMDEKPARRYVSCGDFVRALRGERVGGRRKRSAETSRKLWRAVGLAAAAIAVLALGAVAVTAIARALNSAGSVTAGMPAEPQEPQKVTYAARNTQPVVPLVATSALPEEGKPWVASTVPMEFVWVFEMQAWVGRFEVTNEEYRKMNPTHESGRFVSPKGSQAVSLEGRNHPVVSVNFAEAYRYAKWLTEREREAGKLPEGLVYRLPSAAEAEAYIRAGAQGEYPWGDALPPVRGNYADDTLAAIFSDMPVIEGYRDGAICTAEVQESGENAWGIFGANGNVWETTSREPGDSHFGGWLGGGWDDWQPSRLRASARYGFRGDAHGMVNGFRLLLAPVAAPREPVAE